ncbi:uncharacterized protein [Watersipora subatra]|uniref:uncharacterized protein n=1 Tax=Watersipora subatra TaxID=2589382 RepID=UPI00355BD19F
MTVAAVFRILCFRRCASLCFCAYIFFCYLIGSCLIGWGSSWSTGTKLIEFFTEEPITWRIKFALKFSSILIGCIFFGLGVIACVGKVTERPVLLKGTKVCLALFAIILLGASIFVWSFQNEFEEIIKIKISKSVLNYAEMFTSDESFLDNLQYSLRCCGYNNSSLDYSSFVSQHGRFPISCPTDEHDRRQLLPNTSPCLDVAKSVITRTVQFVSFTLGILSIYAALGILSVLLFSHHPDPWARCL